MNGYFKCVVLYVCLFVIVALQMELTPGCAHNRL